MSDRKSIDEQIEALQQKKKQLEEREKRLKARKKEKAKSDFNKEYGGSDERRARTHRLCTIGGTVESVLGREISGQQDINRLKEFLMTQENRGQYFSRAMNGTKSSDPEQY